MLVSEGIELHEGCAEAETDTDADELRKEDLDEVGIEEGVGTGDVDA